MILRAREYNALSLSNLLIMNESSIAVILNRYVAGIVSFGKTSTDWRGSHLEG